MRKLLAIFVLSLTMTSCIKHEHFHGYSFESKDLDSVKTGITTENEILEKFGSPTITSDFGPKTYFYISMKQTSFAFLPSKTEEQIVLELRFNQKNVVDKMETYTLESANKITYASDNTKIKGNEINPFEHILNNIGKFNNPKSNKPK